MNTNKKLKIAYLPGSKIIFYVGWIFAKNFTTYIKGLQGDIEMQSKWDIHEKLYIYVDKRDIKMVSKLLDDGANATKCTSYGRSAIGQATFKGYSEILSILLKSCEEEYVSLNGCSPKKPRTANLEFDIERTPDGMDGLQWDDEMQGVSNYATADDEWSRLYMYYARMFEQTGELLANTVKLKDPHCLDAYHQAPIHYAAVLDHVECLNILLENGSPVDITTQNGVTPLHLAVKNNNIVEILLQHKADPNRKIYNTGETVLHVAAKMGNVKVVEILLQAGSEINTTNNKGQTPLMTAISNGNEEVAFYLLTKEAKINLQDDQGFTAIYYAAVMNNVRLTSHLLQNGARPFVTHYLLHICVQNNFLEIARLLIEAGENVNIRFSGYTPLYLAIKQCNADMVDYLLKNGAQKFNRSVTKEFHVAVQNAESLNDFIKVARVLLDHGVCMDDENYWGETPLMTAIMLEQFEIAAFLIKEGADINKIRNENYADNFLFEKSHPNWNLLKLLVNAGLKIHPKPTNLKKAPWENVEGDFDDWLGYYCHNPLSLQSLSRIKVRNLLLINIKADKAEASGCDESKLFKLIKQLSIPKPLQTYLYEFDDIPKITNKL
ncbi:ankyrin-1 [Condylostylus longicornis]|uniref:ankyrin-1 n=1 Tax=Condylostylus longicornis TaxID=2530218 RepID=UPI00244DC77E|nr:ankyrin-1 [Condylostylus longicornis]